MGPLLRCPDTNRLSSASRHRYIKIARRLTAPLIAAYKEMVAITITKRDRAQGTRDYSLPDDHDLDILPNEYDSTFFSHLDHLELAALHPQSESDNLDPLSLNTDRVLNPTQYTISDSSLRMPESAGT
jgi:hypothetical protein